MEAVCPGHPDPDSLLKQCSPATANACNTCSHDSMATLTLSARHWSSVIQHPSRLSKVAAGSLAPAMIQHRHHPQRNCWMTVLLLRPRLLWLLDDSAAAKVQAAAAAGPAAGMACMRAESRPVTPQSRQGTSKHQAHSRKVWPSSLVTCVAGRDKMDLTAFADFVLAWDHRSHPAAMKYFFPVLNLSNQVGTAEIYTFSKEIHVMWVNMGEYADLTIYDVVDKILDMVKPKTATLITPEDLEVSGMSGIFFSMLADIELFHSYNYQEPGAVLVLLPGWVDEGARTSSTKRKAEGQAQGHQPWLHPSTSSSTRQPGQLHRGKTLQPAPSSHWSSTPWQWVNFGLDIACHCLVSEYLTSNRSIATALGAHFSRSQGLSAANIYLDIAKAFDTVDRHFLYTLMHTLGASDGMLGVRIGGSRLVCTFFADDTQIHQGDLTDPALSTLSLALTTFGDASGQRPPFLTFLEAS
ncbi:hypothetical protein V8C86DRAFT_3026952 [Haematococcus lacustris]